MTPILMTGQAAGLTPELHARMLSALEPAMRAAPGFLLHALVRGAGGELRVIELWRSKGDSDRFFAGHVAPALPPGLRPKRLTEPLASPIFVGAAVQTSGFASA